MTIGQRLDFVRLHTAAKRRIANTFGATRASPVKVDFRERYMWSVQSGAVGGGTVKQWRSRSQFFGGDDDELKGELIPGSRRVPLDQLDEAVRRSNLATDAPVVVYCAGTHCSMSREAAEN